MPLRNRKGMEKIGESSVNTSVMVQILEKQDKLDANEERIAAIEQNTQEALDCVKQIERDLAEVKCEQTQHQQILTEYTDASGFRTKEAEETKK